LNETGWRTTGSKVKELDDEIGKLIVNIKIIESKLIKKVKLQRSNFS